jgi:hypothetical protein
MKNIKEVFGHHCEHLVFDQVLLRKVQTYEQKFVNKNEAHISFFGGNLLGVDAVRFKDEDRNRWFEEIMDVDEDALEDDLHALPEVVTHRHVSSDTMNLACLWMIHKFLTSDKLNDQAKHDGAFAVALVLQYKYITSILANMFHYAADPIVAQATYAALTKRFGLKIHGNWGDLLKNRAEDIVGKGTLWYKHLITFDHDIDKIANDTQGRIKDIVKNIRDMFTVVQNSPEMQIRNNSATIELDGELKLRDRSRMVSTYMRYILEIIYDQNNFIVPELVNVILRTINTLPKSALVKTLAYMSNNASPKADKRVQRICELVIQHAFDYISRNPSTMASSSDIPGLLRKMKSLYQASRTSNEMILEMRELTEEIAVVAVRSKNKVLIPAIRNAVLLYVLLRAFTMQHYRGGNRVGAV